MDSTGSEQSSMAGFGIKCVELSGSGTEVEVC